MKTGLIRAAAKRRFSLDPYWSNVVLAMHMDGSDNGTTFTDEKGKNVTASAVLTKTAVKKYGSASAYFNGSSVGSLGLRVPGANDFDLPLVDFTIEYYINLNSLAQASPLGQDYQGSKFSWAFWLDGSNNLLFLSSSNGTSWNMINTNVGTGLSTSTWYHVAVTRSGNVFRTFLNGTKTSEIVDGSTIYSYGGDCIIGAHYTEASIFKLNGYIDDLRITKGVSRYTANFAPPTKAFPGFALDPLWSYVRSQHSFEPNGSDIISGWTINRNAPSYSGGGMINTSNAADTGLMVTKAGSAITTQNFTIDGVFEYMGFNSNVVNVIFDSRTSPTGSGFLIYIVNDGGAKLRVSDASAGYAATVNLVLSTNTKYYFALKRSGTTWELYVGLMGGVLTSASVTCPSNLSAGDTYYLGNHYGSGNYAMMGTLYSFRITEAIRTLTVAPAVENFWTPYIYPYILMHMDGVDNGNSFPVWSSVVGTTATAYGTNISTKTAIYKYGTASTSFNGVDDNIVIPNNPVLDFGTGDFTAECWMYYTGGALHRYDVAFAIHNGADQFLRFGFGDGGYGFDLQCMGPGGAGTNSLGTYDRYNLQNVWTHLAVTRSSGTIRFFVNGVNLSEQLNNTYNYSGFKLEIGANIGVQRFQGYIDDIRVLKGHAAYTADFTPPATPLNPV